MECLMPQANDFSRSLVPFEQNSTLVAVIELSQSSWLIAGTVPGIDRQPLKKITPDETVLLRLLHRWRDEAIGKGRTITRIAVAFEAGRDGFWLARWLAKQGIEMHVIHSSSVAGRWCTSPVRSDRVGSPLSGFNYPDAA
jgi:transposase